MTKKEKKKERISEGRRNNTRTRRDKIVTKLKEFKSGKGRRREEKKRNEKEKEKDQKKL